METINTAEKNKGQSGYETLGKEVPFAGNKKPEGRPEESKRLSAREFWKKGDVQIAREVFTALNTATPLISESKKDKWAEYVIDNTNGYTYDKGEHILRISTDSARKIPTVLESLNRKTSLMDVCKDISSNSEHPAEVLDVAFHFSNQGPALRFLYLSDTIMPLDSSKRPHPLTSNQGLTVELAVQTKKNNPSSPNTVEDYKQSIAETQKLWKESEGIISDEDREAWRQTLCVNALSDSAGADTKHALEIMKTLQSNEDKAQLAPEVKKKIDDFLESKTEKERKIILESNILDITKEKYPQNFEKLRKYKKEYNNLKKSQDSLKKTEITPDKFTINEKVLVLVLRYSKQGPKFFIEQIGKSPSQTEMKLLANEAARRTLGVSSYDKVPQNKKEEALRAITGFYKKLQPESKVA